MHEYILSVFRIKLFFKVWFIRKININIHNTISSRLNVRLEIEPGTTQHCATSSLRPHGAFTMFVIAALLSSRYSNSFTKWLYVLKVPLFLDNIMYPTSMFLFELTCINICKTTHKSKKLRTIHIMTCLFANQTGQNNIFHANRMNGIME